MRATWIARIDQREARLPQGLCTSVDVAELFRSVTLMEMIRQRAGAMQASYRHKRNSSDDALTAAATEFSCDDARSELQREEEGCHRPHRKRVLTQSCD